MDINKIYNEANLDTMRRMPDNFLDSIVTDPPYELGFMGKKWDNTGIAYSVELWKECLRVLKPGGYLLAFSGTRTYHRMTCAIEDAGFEIRDMIEWIYGSGFPKSLDVSKAIDKQAGAEREVVGVKPGHEEFANRGNLSSVQSFNGTLGSDGGFSRPWMNNPEKVEQYHMATAPSTDSAKQWQGWGTALKPAHEPICMARKPLSEKTVADNVLKYGTGGINVDACRVETDDKMPSVEGGIKRRNKINQDQGFRPYEKGFDNQDKELWNQNSSGRFPANLIHDGSPEAVGIFPNSSVTGVRKSPHEKKESLNTPFTMGNPLSEYTDSGSAARFFYCAKTSPAERNMGCDDMEAKVKDAEYRQPTGNAMVDRIHGCGIPKKNNHPTIKPIALMKYLIKMVTQPGGLVYDPFSGSGSTLIACRELGMNFIGSELQDEYCKIALCRLSAAKEPDEVKPKYVQQSLF